MNSLDFDRLRSNLYVQQPELAKVLDSAYELHEDMDSAVIAVSNACREYLAMLPDVVDWNRVPEGFDHVARDGSGDCYAYMSVPITSFADDWKTGVWVPSHKDEMAYVPLDDG